MVVSEGKLHPVQPALAAAPCRIPERAHQHGDLLGLDLVRHLAVDFLRNLRGRQQDVPPLHVGLRPPAHVGELAHDPAAVAVHRVRETPIAGDDRVVVVGDHVPGAGRRGGVDAGRAADDGEARAAPGLGFVVGAEARAGVAVLGHGLGVPGREDAVLEGEPADPEGREEMAKLVRHGPQHGRERTARQRAGRSFSTRTSIRRSVSRPLPRRSVERSAIPASKIGACHILTMAGREPAVSRE